MAHAIIEYNYQLINLIKGLDFAVPMSSEEIINKARELVIKLRTAEELIRSGKLDDGVKLFKEATKEAKEAKLFDNYIAIIRKVRKLINEERARQARKSVREAKAEEGKA